MKVKMFSMHATCADYLEPDINHWLEEVKPCIINMTQSTSDERCTITFLYTEPLSDGYLKRPDFSEYIASREAEL